MGASHLCTKTKFAEIVSRLAQRYDAVSRDDLRQKVVIVFFGNHPRFGERSYRRAIEGL